MRTQIDFHLERGITAHPNNKTRLNRFICVYNGHYARKQDGTRLKMNIYTLVKWLRDKELRVGISRNVADLAHFCA